MLLIIMHAACAAGGASGIYYYRHGRRISPWHDIPFEAGKDKNGTALLSFVCEIPRLSRPKNEVHKT